MDAPQQPIHRGQGVVIFASEALTSQSGPLNNKSGIIVSAWLTAPIPPHSSKWGLRALLLKVKQDGLLDEGVNQCQVQYPHPAVPFEPGDRSSRLPPKPWLVEFQTSPWE